MFPKRAPSGGSAARLALALSIALVPLSRAAAQEFEAKPSLTVAQEWDDNVLSRDTDEESSWLTRTSPGILLTARDEKGTINLDLGLTFRNYWSVREIDGTDQRYALRGTRKLSDRLEIAFNGSHRVADKRDDIFENVDGSDFLIQSERPDVIYDDADVTATYALSPRTNFVASGRWEKREYDDNRLIRDSSVRDLDTIGGTLGLDHILTPLDRLSLSLGASRSDQDPASEISTVADQRDLLTTLSLGWTRAWSPKWSSRASIGQRWIHAERFDVRQAVTTGNFFQDFGTGAIRPEFEIRSFDESDRSDGLIASLTTTRTLPRGELSFGYSRDARTGGAGATTSSSVEINTFFASFTHQLTDRIRFRANASRSDYESIGEFDVPISPVVLLTDTQVFAVCPPGTRTDRFPSEAAQGGIACIFEADSEIDLEQVRLDLQLDWRLRRTLNAFLRFSLIDQDSEGRTLRTFERHRVSLGFRYLFDPE